MQHLVSKTTVTTTLSWELVRAGHRKLIITYNNYKLTLKDNKIHYQLIKSIIL